MIFVSKYLRKTRRFQSNNNNPAGIYLLKFNYRNTRTTYKQGEICSKLTTTDDAVLVSLLLTLNIFHNLFYCFYC